MQDEHEMVLVTQARGSNHRRHDSDDDRQTRNGYRRTEGISRFERCVDVQGNSREETYVRIKRTLRSYNYRYRPRLEKGLIRSYMQKIMGSDFRKRRQKPEVCSW